MRNHGILDIARLRLLLLALSGALAAGCATRSPTTPNEADVAVLQVGAVSVGLADPAGFDLVRGGGRESPSQRRAWAEALGRHLAERAAPLLPPGQQLQLRLTDVERAGGFEPWHGPHAAELRIVRDIYPPRIDIEFRRLAADGSVLEAGARRLRDSAFMLRTNLYHDDPLRHEKALIDAWLQRELGSLRQAP